MAVIDADGAQDIGAGVTMPRMLLKSLYLGCAGVLGSLMMIDLIMIVGTLSTALPTIPPVRFRQPRSWAGFCCWRWR